MNKTLEKDETGATIMNLRNLKLICEKEDLYQCPELNSTLYLHFKGFEKIQNLDPYSNLVALYLNNNAISVLEGLESLTKLTSLFASHNMITKIQGLDTLLDLYTLNLSHNRIKTIENLTMLSKLKNLNLSYNNLTNYESLEGLACCKQIQNLDLSNNYIEYDEIILYKIFSKMELRCLYLKGNDIVREFPNYRKTFIVRIPPLLHLDDKPISQGERRVSEAWQAGGKDAEREERQRLQEEKRVQDRKVYESTLKVQQQGEERQRLLKRQEWLKQEIKELQELSQESEEVLKLLEEHQNELVVVEQELEKLAPPHLEPWKCFVTTKDKDGNIVICNKTEQEAKLILEKYYNPEILELNRSEREQLKELKQRQYEEQLLKEQDQEYQELLEQRQIKERKESREKEMTVQPGPKKAEPVFEDKQTQQLREWKRLREGWTKDHDELLENLLMYHRFNFEMVSYEMKKIMDLESQEQISYLEPEDLRKIWTFVELAKYRNKEPKVSELDGLD